MTDAGIYWQRRCHQMSLTEGFETVSPSHFGLPDHSLTPNSVARRLDIIDQQRCCVHL